MMMRFEFICKKFKKMLVIVLSWEWQKWSNDCWWSKRNEWRTMKI